MAKKGTKQAVVIYAGALYEDAENACKQRNTTITNKCAKSTNARAVSQKDARRDAYILLALSNGYDESAELYAAPVGMYNTFCNLFWLESSKYIVENPPKKAQQLKTITAAELNKKPLGEGDFTKAINKTNNIVLAVDGAIDSLNAVNGRLAGNLEKAIAENANAIINALASIDALSNNVCNVMNACTNGLIDNFRKDFGAYAKNFIRASEDARAAYKTLDVIAESSIEISETLKKIDAKLGKLETRQEEMNQRLNGLSQVETGISANVAKMVTFVDRFTKR